ncbi:MAG TPA: hypothetical protein VN755_09375, partial [Steroidobacteraceae bacterium]|nr:hypothetical protein [Steroidobacteraceae bacterium]
MRQLTVLIAAVVCGAVAGALAAQQGSTAVNVTTTPDGKPLAPLTRAADQLQLVKSADARLARNKQHVYDFWRIVYEGGHMERAAE